VRCWSRRPRRRPLSLSLRLSLKRRPNLAQKKAEPIIDALPAEAELPPSPPELIREPSKRKKAAPKAAAGLSGAPPKRVKKVQLPHEVQMADTTEPPCAAPTVTHNDLHGMFRQYLGNHKLITQQAKRDMYRQWLMA
jgi:hypothetical protein